MDSLRLQKENNNLKAHLHELLGDACHNEQVMRKIQRHELLLLGSENLPQLLEHLTVDTCRYFTLDAVQLIILDGDSRTRSLLQAIGFTHLSENIQFVHQLPHYYQNMTQPVLSNRNNMQHRELFNLSDNIQSSVCIPLLRGSRIIGCLNLGSTDPNRFHKKLASDFLLRLGYIAAVCLENASNHLQLLISGMTDPLTGLYNRRLLDLRLNEEVTLAIRHQSPLSCLFIDADHFKQINDQYGHASGDQVLKSLAQNISSLLRTHDIAVRYGGEEFAILLPQTSLQKALLLANRISRKVSNTTIITDNQNVQVTVSIGVAELDLLKPVTLQRQGERMIQQADAAVYKAKSDDRNCVRYTGSFYTKHVR